jgi:hypothetical protein
MKISKIKNIQSLGTWEGKYGTMYKHEIWMEDDQVLTANTKTAEAPYKIGDEVEYNITKPANEKYSAEGKVKKYDPNAPQRSESSNGGGRFSAEDKLQIIRQSSLKASAEFYAQRNAKEDDMLNFAERMTNWVLTGNKTL